MSEEIQEIDIVELQQNVKPRVKRKPRKKATVIEADSVDIEADMNHEEQELEFYREQLLTMADTNPDIVLKPINDRVDKLVSQMSLQELKTRCRNAKRINSSKMNSVVSQQVIAMCNYLVGSLLGVVEELEESTCNDELLHDTINGYLSLHVLDLLNDEMKIGGLYASHVLSAYNQSFKRKSNNNDDVKEKLIAFKSKLEELKQDFEPEEV